MVQRTLHDLKTKTNKEERSHPIVLLHNRLCHQLHKEPARPADPILYHNITKTAKPFVKEYFKQLRD